MKKKYFVIALMAFLCAAFIYMGIGRHSYNYKIVGLSLQRVIVQGQTFNSPNALYLLNFDVEFCNTTTTFWQAPLGPGLEGSIDSIKHITIYDSIGNDITKFFSNKEMWKKRIEVHEFSNDNHSYLSYAIFDGVSIRNIIHNINANNDSGEKFTITNSQYYFIDEREGIPNRIMLYTSAGTIVGNVYNKPITLEIIGR